MKILITFLNIPMPSPTNPSRQFQISLDFRFFKFVYNEKPSILFLVFPLCCLEKLLTLYDARQVSDFWGFEPLILAVLPATLPLRFALKPTQYVHSINNISQSVPGVYKTSLDTYTKQDGGRGGGLDIGLWKKSEYLKANCAHNVQGFY